MIALDLPAEGSAPAAVRGALRALAESCPSVHLDSTELLEMCGAVQEAVTNVIRHGLSGDRERRFRVEMHRRPDALEVVVVDHGPAYDVVDVSPPEPEELREGGYGVHIMHSWADEVRLERVAGANRLRLVRLYRVAEEVAS
jgi:serine/threonine-protein kinase RsbW